MPAFEDPYEGVDERRRLVTLYQKLHDAIHARSGQGETLKLQYIKTEKESVMGWVGSGVPVVGKGWLTSHSRLPSRSSCISRCRRCCRRRR